MIALSVDPLDKAREVVDQSKLEYPLAYGLKVPEDAERIGAWWDGKRPMIQPSEFVLTSAGKIVSATYSTGPIGRVQPADVLSMVQFLEMRKQEQKK